MEEFGFCFSNFNYIYVLSSLLFDWLRVTRLLSSVEPLWYLSVLDRTWSSFVSLIGVWSLPDLRDDSLIIW